MSKVSPTPSKAEKRSSKAPAGGAGKSGEKGGLPMPLIFGVVGFLIFIGILLFFFMGGNDKPVDQNVEVVVPQSAELNTGDSEMIPIEESTPDLLVVDQTVSSDPFSSADPINALTEEAVTNAIKTDPSYTENVGLLMPDGTLFTENTAEFNALKQEVGGPVHADLTVMIVGRDGSTGTTWVFNDVSSGEGPIPLASQDAKAKATRFALQSASKHLQDVKIRYSQQVAAVVDPNAPVAQAQAVQAEPIQRIVEVSSINDEERQLLNSIVQELRTQNKASKMELESAKADKKSTERELVQLRQRVENNPALKTAIQATMLPESSGYKLEAVMGNQIFLRDLKTGESTIVQQGHRIPNSSLVISSADMDSGIVLVTPAR